MIALRRCGERAARSEVGFLLVWIAAPALLRLASLVTFSGAERSLGARLARLTFRMLMSLPQDLIVAFEMLCIVLLGRWLLGRVRRPGSSIPAIFTTGLFLLVHLYLLSDFLLYTKIGIRMDLEFLGYLWAPSSFASSVREIGLGPLLGGFLALGLATCLAYLFFRRAVGGLRFTVGTGLGLAASVATGLAFSATSTVDLAYAISNAVLGGESALLRESIFSGSPFGKVPDGLGIALATPQAEIFERVDPRYPLFKNTKGFTGDKEFGIRIAQGERPHVVFLFMESFRAADIGVLGGKHGASPRFDELSKQGVLFTRFYGNGVQTTHGALASLFGILPRFSPRSPQAPSSGRLIGIPDLFARRGYLNAYFFAGSLELEHQRSFFGSHGYRELHGGDEIGKAFPGAPRTSWGIADEYLMRYLVDDLAAKDAAGIPTFATAFTITNHHPWHIPPDYAPPPLHVPGDEEYHRFLQTFHYADHCLGLFMDLLRERGLARKTIVFVEADTSNPMGEHLGNHMLINYLFEENVRIPLLILADGRLERPAVIDEIGSQVDLLPTVMDLFGMTGLNHAIGTSLVRSVPNRTAYFVNPFALGYTGLREGDGKLILNMRSMTPALYDLGVDPHEEHDLAAQAPEVTRKYDEKVRALNELVSRLSSQKRLAGSLTDDSPHP